MKFDRNKEIKLLFFIIISFLLGLTTLAVSDGQANNPTTEIRVVKYAPDKETVIAEKTVEYKWMEAHLPVYGDGKTHYYLQGPVFEEAWQKVFPDQPYNRWNPEENINVESRDLGAVKGTNVKDLCELVGGMLSGDEVRIKSTDGFYKWFAYENIYIPSRAQGPLVLCWHNGEESKDVEYQGTGYPPDYAEGIRLVFFADPGNNPEGRHCFGNEDMKNCLAKKYWHFYKSGTQAYPSSSGLSVKWVSEVAIFTKVSKQQVDQLTHKAAKEGPESLDRAGNEPVSSTPKVSEKKPEVIPDGGVSFVKLPAVGIFLNKNKVNLKEKTQVQVTNLCSQEVEVNLEVKSKDERKVVVDQSLLYINNVSYNPTQPVAKLSARGTKSVFLELKNSPARNNLENKQEDIIIIFWAKEP